MQALAIIPAMHTPSRWLDEPELHQLCADPAGIGWLQERGSLTERLRHHWGDVAVHLLDEGLAAPLPHESLRLGPMPPAPAWVRCVLLVCQGQARVYARTVIPGWQPRNPWAEVQRLGRQPLGELLFRRPDLQRSGFDWSDSETWPHAGHWSRRNALARRCVFVREQAPLLLTEVFLDLPCVAGPPMHVS